MMGFGSFGIYGFERFGDFGVFGGVSEFIGFLREGVSKGKGVSNWETLRVNLGNLMGS